MQDLDAQCHLLMAVRTFQDKIRIRVVLQARQHALISQCHIRHITKAMIAVRAFQFGHEAPTVVLSLLSQ